MFVYGIVSSRTGVLYNVFMSMDGAEAWMDRVRVRLHLLRMMDFYSELEIRLMECREIIV